MLVKKTNTEFFLLCIVLILFLRLHHEIWQCSIKRVQTSLMMFFFLIIMHSNNIIIYVYSLLVHSSSHINEHNLIIQAFVAIVNFTNLCAQEEEEVFEKTYVQCCLCTFSSYNSENNSMYLFNYYIYVLHNYNIKSM